MANISDHFRKLGRRVTEADTTTRQRIVPRLGDFGAGLTALGHYLQGVTAQESELPQITAQTNLPRTYRCARIRADRPTADTQFL